LIRAYLVDDEPLALRRLERMLAETARVTVIGSSSDPVSAVKEIEASQPAALFLDIQMPELTGFDLLARLRCDPLVVFTTAYDQYALRAFEVNSIDYLLKPVEAAGLERAVAKLERILSGGAPRPDMAALVKQLREAMQSRAGAYPDRIASRLGERVHFVELGRVTHFFAKDKLTYAATAEKNWVVDKTITELEQKLDPTRFCRVHRSTLVNLAYVDELYPWFGGRMVLRLKDVKRSEITVARDRLKDLRDRLGL
jgi:two-component system LytT family response regulator